MWLCHRVRHTFAKRQDSVRVIFLCPATYTNWIHEWKNSQQLHIHTSTYKHTCLLACSYNKKKKNPKFPYVERKML